MQPWSRPISDGNFDELLQNDGELHQLRLLRVHGVFNVGNLRLDFERPLKSPEEFILKKSGKDEIRFAFFNIPSGISKFSLDRSEKMFIAWDDCAKLEAGLTSDSPAWLRSELVEINNAFTTS